MGEGKKSDGGADSNITEITAAVKSTPRPNWVYR